MTRERDKIHCGTVSVMFILLTCVKPALEITSAVVDLKKFSCAYSLLSRHNPFSCGNITEYQFKPSALCVDTGYTHHYSTMLSSEPLRKVSLISHTCTGFSFINL